MTPADVQARLAHCYELALPLDVESVLTSDPAMARSLLPDGARQPREQLLVHQAEDAVELALYLHDDVLQTLRRHDPRERLGAENLAELALLAEGVSHFVCLSWNGHNDRRVSALELELQAEIDVFLLATDLAGPGRGGMVVRALFDRVGFSPDLDAEERGRYRTAHRLAARYCLDLLRRHGDRLQQPEVRRRLRRFYRLDRAGKFAAIGGG
ncbi:MAG: hypothetical protein KF823_09470 [Xanthomonadales bacterium]|nr:hypothetical protein [Xanthomonadales bacterium]